MEGGSWSPTPKDEGSLWKSRKVRKNILPRSPFRGLSSVHQKTLWTAGFQNNRVTRLGGVSNKFVVYDKNHIALALPSEPGFACFHDPSFHLYKWPPLQ